MTRIVLLMLLVFMNGCAVMKTGDGGLLHHYRQSRDLSRATAMLESGDRAGAAKNLATISESSGVSGVTDEALFRLALLSLHTPTGRDDNHQALQLLKRLKMEYPASPWTAQSVQLIELLTGQEELRRQARSLKSHNQSLANEVKELNRNIDQLKRLDQELEKKRR